MSPLGNHTFSIHEQKHGNGEVALNLKFTWKQNYNLNCIVPTRTKIIFVVTKIILLVNWEAIYFL